MERRGWTEDESDVTPSAQKLMQMDNDIWDEHGWDEGRTVDDGVYKEALRSKLRESGCEPMSGDYDIIEDYNYHTLNKALEELKEEGFFEGADKEAGKMEKTARLVQVHCTKCGEDFKLDIGDKSREEVEAGLEARDGFECPGHHVELSSPSNYWEIDWESAEEGSAPTDEEWLAKLRESYDEVYDTAAAVKDAGIEVTNFSGGIPIAQDAVTGKDVQLDFASAPSGKRYYYVISREASKKEAAAVDVLDILWDTTADEDDEYGEDLPSSVTVEVPEDIGDEDMDGYINDALVEDYGFNTRGFFWDRVGSRKSAADIRSDLNRQVAEIRAQTEEMRKELETGNYKGVGEIADIMEGRFNDIRYILERGSTEAAKKVEADTGWSLHVTYMVKEIAEYMESYVLTKEEAEQMQEDDFAYADRIGDALNQVTDGQFGMLSGDVVNHAPMSQEEVLSALNVLENQEALDLAIIMPPGGEEIYGDAGLEKTKQQVMSAEATKKTARWVCPNGHNIDVVFADSGTPERMAQVDVETGEPIGCYDDGVYGISDEDEYLARADSEPQCPECLEYCDWVEEVEEPRPYEPTDMDLGIDDRVGPDERMASLEDELVKGIVAGLKREAKEGLGSHGEPAAMEAFESGDYDTKRCRLCGNTFDADDVWLEVGTGYTPESRGEYPAEYQYEALPPDDPRVDQALSEGADLPWACPECGSTDLIDGDEGGSVNASRKTASYEDLILELVEAVNEAYTLVGQVSHGDEDDPAFAAMVEASESLHEIRDKGFVTSEQLRKLQRNLNKAYEMEREVAGGDLEDDVVMALSMAYDLAVLVGPGVEASRKEAKRIMFQEIRDYDLGHDTSFIRELEMTLETGANNNVPLMLQFFRDMKVYGLDEAIVYAEGYERDGGLWAGTAEALKGVAERVKSEMNVVGHEEPAASCPECGGEYFESELAGGYCPGCFSEGPFKPTKFGTLEDAVAEGVEAALRDVLEDEPVEEESDWKFMNDIQLIETYENYRKSDVLVFKMVSKDLLAEIRNRGLDKMLRTWQRHGKAGALWDGLGEEEELEGQPCHICGGPAVFDPDPETPIGQIGENCDECGDWVCQDHYRADLGVCTECAKDKGDEPPFERRASRRRR